MEAIGVALVCVLGDQRYYSRFAFKTETRVLPPYPIPEVWREAWQSIRIGGLNDALAGKLMVIPPWRDPALWGP